MLTPKLFEKARRNFFKPCHMLRDCLGDDDELFLIVEVPVRVHAEEIPRQRRRGDSQRSRAMKAFDCNDQRRIYTLRKLPILLLKLAKEWASKPNGDFVEEVLLGFSLRLGVGKWTVWLRCAAAA